MATLWNGMEWIEKNETAVRLRVITVVTAMHETGRDEMNWLNGGYHSDTKPLSAWGKYWKWRMIYYEIFVYVVKMCFSLNIHINAMRWRKLSFLSSRFFRFALIHYLEFWFLCVCSFVQAQLFQLKIIYFEVHWVSYQDGQFFFSVSLLFAIWFWAKMMLKDTCTDTSKNVFAFLMENCGHLFNERR